MPGDAKTSILGNFEGYAISKNTNSFTQCWEWIKFLSHQPHPRLLSARPELATDQSYRRKIGLETVSVAVLAAQDIYWVKNTNAVNFDKALNPLLKAVNNFVTQGSSPRQAVQQALQITSP